MAITNVKVTVSSYAAHAGSSYTMYIPGAVFVSDQYAKTTCHNVSGSHSVKFCRQSYENYGDNIMFQIFPLGMCWSSSQLSGTIFQVDQQYPSMTVTPSGNFITSPLYVGNKKSTHVKNGLYGFDTSTTETSKFCSLYSVSHSTYSTLMNWTVSTSDQNGIFSKASNLLSSTYYSDKDNIKSSLTACQGNFGKRQEGQVGTNFQFVNALAVDAYGCNNKVAKVNPFGYVSKRVYRLSSTIANGLSSSICTDAGLAYSSSDSANPFAFGINLSFFQGGGEATLDFGYNRITFDNSGVTAIVNSAALLDSNGKVVDSANQVRCNIEESNNISCIKPFWANSKLFKGNSQKQYFLIAYPCYNGMAVQSGVQYLSDNQSTGNQNGAISPCGTFCQVYSGVKTRYPTMDTWIQNIKDQKHSNILSASDSDSTVENMYFVPHNIYMQGCVTLTLLNCTANFFYAPILFNPKAKFRMYFKGVKHGKYDQQSFYPEQGGQNQDTTSSCGICTKAIQYMYDKNGGKASAYLSHTYTASLMYTVYPKNSSFLTSPVSSYRIPPYKKDSTRTFLQGGSTITAACNKDYWATYNMDAYYFQFGIKPTSASVAYLLSPVEILGVLLLDKMVCYKSIIKNDNGTFSMGIDSQYQSLATTSGVKQLPCIGGAEVSNWSNCIQSINTSWSQTGGNGTITIDKYALFGGAQKLIPAQSIGGISLSVSGGNPNIITLSGGDTNVARGPIFSGFVTAVQTSDSFNSDTITLKLQGPQKKLHQLKLILAPFWDGDVIDQPISWLSYYAGISIKLTPTTYFNRSLSYSQAAPTAKNYFDSNGSLQSRKESNFPKLPTSSDFHKPAVYFPNGTSVLQAINSVCNACNCRFILQPNGIGYVMTLTENALPPMADANANTTGYAVPGYADDIVLSFSMQPQFNNLYNFIHTVALKPVQKGINTGASQGKAEDGFGIVQKSTSIKTVPQIPWHKIKVVKQQGFLNEQQLNSVHLKHVHMSKFYSLQISITIPGNSRVLIYDTLTVFGIKCCVLQISQNVDTSSKKWTTTLTLCQVYPKSS